MSLSKMGVNLTDIAHGSPPDPCGCLQPRFWRIVHHDHIVDFAHERLRDAFGGRKAEGSGEDEFSRWCRMRGPAFYDFASSISFDGGCKLVRFQPVVFCRDCNAKDGNGKRRVRSADVRWYSMTADQLSEVTMDRDAWAKHYEQDRIHLRKRLTLMAALVDAEVISFSVISRR